MPGPSAQTQTETRIDEYGAPLGWEPQIPRFRLLPLLVTWLVAGCSVLVAAAVLPGVSVPGFGGALAAAAVIAVLNALLPPIVAALRLPWTVAIGFVGVLMIDALILLLTSHLTSRAIHVDSFGWALLCALVISAVVVVLQVILGPNDDDTYSLRVIRRFKRRRSGVSLGREGQPAAVLVLVARRLRRDRQRAARRASHSRLSG